MKIGISYYPEEEKDAEDLLNRLKELKPKGRVRIGKPRDDVHHFFLSTPRPGTEWGNPK